MPEASPERARFLAWARRALIPLSSVTPDAGERARIGAAIGGATVVALGEGDHLDREPLEFRNRLFQYLVEEKGFTAIALESGMVEGRVVHDYVRGAPGNITEVLAAGISWTFDRLPQNQVLVAWLRDYNARPNCPRKVNFYGFDVSGSPGEPNARRGLTTALVAALNYVAQVDGALGADLFAGFDAFLPNLHFVPFGRLEGPGYLNLNQSERDTLTARIADLVALLERHEARYAAASSTSDYEWAYRSAVGARQVDGWLRQIPLDWRASSEQLRFLGMAGDLRDRAQADNVDWIARREGRLGKILLFAHNGHLSATTKKRRTWPLGAPDQHQHQLAPDISQLEQLEGAGTYLRRRFGDRLLTIGNLIGKGVVGCADRNQTRAAAQLESIEGIAGEVGPPLYLLDLRQAPPEVAAWLARERRWGPTIEIPNGCLMSLELALGSAFDMLFYVDAVTPACA